MFNDVREKVAALAADNATTLLTAGGVVGTIATAVLTGRASVKAYQVLEENKAKKRAEFLVNVPDDVEEIEMHRSVDELSKLETFVLVAPHFIAPVLLGSGTVAAIIMANRMSAQKMAALAAAYGMSQKHFEEYKQKISEKLTGPKQQQIDEELAQEAVNRKPPSDKMVVVEGEVLCYDKPGGRYFTSSMEQIRQAVNATNAEIFNHGFALLSFFYTELGLSETTWSEEVGFNAENILELTYSTVFAPGNKPCLVFDFARLPKADYDSPKMY